MNNSKLSASDDFWIPDLIAFLAGRGDIEAILFDAKNKKIAVAILGSVDEAEIKRCLQETLSSIAKNVGVEDYSIPYGIQVKPYSGKTLLEKKTCELSPRFRRWSEIPWPAKKPNHNHQHEEDWRFLAVLAGLSGIFGVSGYVAEHFAIDPAWIPIALYVLSMFAGGFHALEDIKHKLLRGELDIHFLMIAVAVGAAAIEAWGEGALLLFLFSLSGVLEQLTHRRTRRAIDGLLKATPKKALIEESNGEEQEVPIEQVAPGQVVIIKPGQQFPVDAEIISGATAIDESTITGEAVPVEKGVGSIVSSGTLNLWGAVKARTLRRANESSLQKIINLIQEAQSLRAPSQQFTDRFGTPYTYGILGLTTLMFFIWWLGFGVSPFHNTTGNFSAFYRSITLLVIASPCALVLSIPSAILAAIAWSASHGILFRGGAAIEKLSEIDLVALDKTGTLTTGELKVEKIESFPQGKEKLIAEMVYSLERSSTHPIARAIASYGKYKGLKIHEIEEFKSLTGSGIQGKIGGRLCVVGCRKLLELVLLSEWFKQVPPAEKEYSEVWIVYEDLIGRILLKDSIREQSKPVLQRLKELGLRTVMLTGDRRETAESIGNELGIQEVYSGLKPEDKVSLIQSFTEEGKNVAMIGDGVNDAPSLAAAYVAVAMGVRGSDAALEQSEVVLMNDRIDYFLDAYELSLRAKKVIRFNLVVSLFAIIIMVIRAIFGIVPLTLGVITHEGSTLLVCASSLSLLYKRKNNK